MRLTVYTDYALRILMYLGTHPDDLCTIQQIADAYGISKNHLMKVAHQLGVSGYVASHRGRGGGLRLAKPPAEIGIGDVVRATEDDFRLVECFDPERNSCLITKACRLRGVLSDALDAYIAVLDRYSLGDLISDETALLELLDGPARKKG
ncbi:Rrf2 family transcriptional regulator [Pelagibius sp. Alg239-R121]|uniref:RrF2 family transcriptional regulator n=1 Tax=Pelagibius sp. Alg239-R121 TaxID=2993448 RepID=UPI0024A6B007|nr:Rrf2 family transcriptional regulator [Pelagibius sp. Alg239-R121]